MRFAPSYGQESLTGGLPSCTFADLKWLTVQAKRNLGLSGRHKDPNVDLAAKHPYRTGVQKVGRLARTEAKPRVQSQQVIVLCRMNIKRRR